jgi:Ni,Fe-hydrogenase III component G
MENIKNKLTDKFRGDILEITIPRERRIFVRVSPKSFKDVFRFAVRELNFDHLCTISGVDQNTDFELLYHLSGEGIVLSICTKLDHTKPEVETVTDIIPGAVLYEREIHEMLGIDVKGLLDVRKLVLPDIWPDGQYPLKKDWKKEMLPESFNDGLRRKWTE